MYHETLRVRVGFPPIKLVRLFFFLAEHSLPRLRMLDLKYVHTEIYINQSAGRLIKPDRTF